MTFANRRQIIIWITITSLLLSFGAAFMPVDTAHAALSGELTLSGSTTVQPVAQSIASQFMKENKGVKMSVAGGGSGTGIKDVAAGRVSIGMSSRDLKPEELGQGLVPTKIGRDALVIIVNSKNPVKNLSADQVKQIYSGAINNWSQVGGKNAPIILVGRTAPSGTFDYFKESFMGETPLAGTVKQCASNGLVRQSVKSNPNAIGFVSISFAKGVKAVSINGKAANLKAAKSGKYPFVRSLYFVTNGKPSGLSKNFIDYALSKKGQKIISKEYIAVK